MSEPIPAQNEAKAARAFNKQSGIFDGLYSHDTIIQYKRGRVRAHVNAHLQPGSRILELNAGTGEDAVYFAQQGYTVHATDISAGMLSILKDKIIDKKFAGSVTHETCAFTSLQDLRDKGPYDMIFSNFAGLNCTDRLDVVLQSLSPLLKKNGLVTLVVLPRFCLWEFLLLFRGKFKTALRRFSGRKGALSHIEGQYFTCWYYNPSFITRQLKDDFKLLGIEGLCSIVPPSYITGFAEKHPRLYDFLRKKEDQWNASWPWRVIGDYYIISFRKK